MIYNEALEILGSRRRQSFSELEMEVPCSYGTLVVVYPQINAALQHRSTSSVIKYYRPFKPRSSESCWLNLSNKIFVRKPNCSRTLNYQYKTVSTRCVLYNGFSITNEGLVFNVGWPEIRLCIYDFM